MGFKENLTFIKNGIIIILILSGAWIILNWLYDITTLDNPPTLKETAQNFIDYWLKSFSKIKIF